MIVMTVMASLIIMVAVAAAASLGAWCWDKIIRVRYRKAALRSSLKKSFPGIFVWCRGKNTGSIKWRSWHSRDLSASLLLLFINGPAPWCKLSWDWEPRQSVSTCQMDERSGVGWVSRNRCVDLCFTYSGYIISFDWGECNFLKCHCYQG